MGDRDGADTAELSHRIDRCVVDHGDAVPQQVAFRGSNQQRALADGKGRFGADADQVQIVAHLVVMLVAQLLEGRPSLAGPSDVLPLVVADGAAVGCLSAGRELNAAGDTDMTPCLAFHVRNVAPSFCGSAIPPATPTAPHVRGGARSSPSAVSYSGISGGSARMQIRLPRLRRPAVTVFGAAIFGALLAGAGPQLPTMLDRPSCTETVMKAVSSDRPVTGTYTCFDNTMQLGRQSVGVDSDSAFATRIGQNGDYRFLHKTEDGGYAYEYDRPTTPHDKVTGAVVALGLPETSADMRGGKLGAALSVRRDIRGAWAELSGQTQNAESRLYTLYVGADGKITAIKSALSTG